MKRPGPGVLVMLFVAAAGAACGSKKPAGAGDPAGSAQPSAGAGAGSVADHQAGSAALPVPPWQLDSQPFELMCGDKAAAKPGPASAGERALPRGTPIGCQDLASVDAVCQCLIASSAKWASGLSAPLTCKPTAHGDARVVLLEVDSNPADTDERGGGVAYILAAAHGDKWSALAEIERAPEIDRSVTPRASHGAEIKAFAQKPAAGGTLVWIQSLAQYEEHAMGELEDRGSAKLTICSVPAAAVKAPFCHAPIALGVWDYTYTDATEACEVRDLAVRAASLDSTGKVTVRLVRGADQAGIAGRYHL